MLIAIIVANVKFVDAIPWATNTPTMTNKSKQRTFRGRGGVEPKFTRFSDCSKMDEEYSLMW